MRPLLLALALLLAVPGSAAAQTQWWRVHASASGSYALDYGSDRDAVDGQAGGNWSWRIKALASGLEVDASIAAFRMDVAESSDIVLADGSPACRPPAAGSVGWLRDWRVLFYLDWPIGFRVAHPFFDLLAGCHVGAHGMTIFDGVPPELARVRRTHFRPGRDRYFRRTWSQQIQLDATHESGPPHEFSATGSLTITLRRISARAARALRLRLLSTPRTPRA
jgi:hypothetical protein